MSSPSKQMEGKTVLITGANTGIGYETALALAKRGARVIIACRDQKRGDEAVAKLKYASGNEAVELELLDLSNLKSVKAISERLLAKLTKLDILINNAGLGGIPYSKTVDGFETTLAVNHLGHFYLTLLLLDLIKKSAPSRIINVSSAAHSFGKINWDDLQSEKSYSGMGAYSQSKLANILFTAELARRLHDTGVTCVSLHPGFVATEFLRNHGSVTCGQSCLRSCLKCFACCFAKRSDDGAATSIYCACDPSIPEKNGLYFDNCKVVKASPEARNMESAAKLWTISERLVGLNQ